MNSTTPLLENHSANCPYHSNTPNSAAQVARPRQPGEDAPTPNVALLSCATPAATHQTALSRVPPMSWSTS
ncbi:hypothetical protein STCU_10124 [Strigomonas culicis]|uniref:Uncharacterized protein n=1 Tax=Strigomonas culicis TaxID=28005 RepID=S9TN94_9TRYP|nr:hypothetical protein STCU_10124 [Strigomonas culicis]|eukprot:EPY18199.1 hypothetical protein STCU_10124 [Strigomonas culicis]